MTRVPFAGSIKTGLLVTGWYANRLEQDAFPGVLTLCYHGLRQSAEDDRETPNANVHVSADTFDAQHSRFMVLAAITAADLAHRIAYAWPR